jgi:Tfp pilus assembly protein PilN
MRAVNLLPRDTGNQSLGADRTLIVGIAVTVFVVVILGGAYFLAQSNAASARQRLAAAQAALAQAESQASSAQSPGPAQLQVPVVLSQQQPWHVALNAALSTRVAWDVLLQQLEYAVPNKISLTSVTLGGAGASAGATSGTITLAGSAFSADDVAVFISTLERLPHVSQVNLVSNTGASGSKVQTFSITAQMTLPAALTAPPPATDTTTTTGG